MTQELAQIQDQLCAAQRHVDELRRTRDELVRRMIDGGVSMYAIAKALGIAPQSVSKIRDG